ncbi:amidohydrolase family protein [Pararobbsia alpina]|uniref:8-oxoguanine deaminase n=1 Tax=Pararobbsia alpina TaxID=621374 RepID=A0A6S7BCP4_9BURK|nr:amidohydrolase family protein [Pararobbsia alpina]CAB3793906.1 8-oxoguanine deaminase [Pararobbsia alpina]
MAYTLIKNAFVVTMDETEGDFRGDILIDGTRIAALGQGLEMHDAAIVDGTDFIVIPGLVNAHLHTWQAGLRTVASNWTLPEYFRWVHAGLATQFEPEDIRIATLAGALNQLENGTTTLADWCHNNPTPLHSDAGIAGLRQAGIRATFMHGTPKPNPVPGQKPFWEVPHPRSEMERLAREIGPDDGLLSLGLAILGPHYSTLEVALEDFALAREFGLVASMHQGGGPAKSPDGWARLEAEGLLGKSINIVHGNDLPDEQLARFVDAGVSFTVTGESEMVSGHGHPIVGRLRDLGVRPSLGSDIECALSGDMLTAARITLSHQRSLDNVSARQTGTLGGKNRMRTRDALAWITIEGARMLGKEDSIGSLAPGKQADLVMISTRSLNMQPVHDPVSAVVMHANQSNIDSVMVAGNWRKRHGRLIHDDVNAVIEALQRSSSRIVGALGIQPSDLQ